MNKSVRIVLVETTHAGNVGGAARAMKNMGFDEMYLVNPCKFRTQDGYARASGANDLMDDAVICEILADALKGCTLVFGTSARARAMQWEDCSLRDAVNSLDDIAEHEKIAFVFGRERSGLTNEELALCHRRVHIPSNPDFSSLNLAAAVQLVTYELSTSLNKERVIERTTNKPEEGGEFAAVDDMDRFYEHLESTLIKLEFLDPENPRLLMRRLRRFYNRSRPSKMELKIFRGILAATMRLSGHDKK